MDFLSDLDVPSFLRNKRSFSLPSQLTELVLYIIEEPVCKPVSVCPMQALEEDSSLLKHKKILETKIKELNAKHHKKMRNKNNNNMLEKVIETSKSHSCQFKNLPKSLLVFCNSVIMVRITDLFFPDHVTMSRVGRQIWPFCLKNFCRASYVFQQNFQRITKFYQNDSIINI